MPGRARFPSFALTVQGMRAGLVLLCIIGIGVGLMALAFYTTTHRIGMCPPANPFCNAHLKSDQVDIRISE